MSFLDSIGNLSDVHGIGARFYSMISKEPELTIDYSGFSTMPPYRIGFSSSIEKNSTLSDIEASLGNTWDIPKEKTIGYVEWCNYIVSIRNKGKSVASIRSISVEKKPFDDSMVAGSMLYIPQSGLLEGPYRFHCNLDSNSPFMQRFDYIDCKVVRYGEQNYFKYGRIEIEPDHSVDVIITLTASNRPYRFSISFRVESPRAGTYILENEESNEGILIPLERIPQNRRFTHSFRPDNTHIQFEHNLKQSYSLDNLYI